MVFAGQDAWRSHPIISGCARRPFPGLGTAAAIFGVYVVADFIYGVATRPPPRELPERASYDYVKSGVGKMPTLEGDNE
ncbi:unnamed protein product [Phaeothamnion confervicola]